MLNVIDTTADSSICEEVACDLELSGVLKTEKKV